MEESTSMRVGVLKEVRDDEGRVAASPDTVKRMKAMGLKPVVEQGAGLGTAITDDAFAAAGATLARPRRATSASPGRWRRRAASSGSPST
jgi:NAD(P) transhydrogenase subunit alpha